MTERERKERLFDEIMPCPEPPPDLAARVLRKLRQPEARVLPLRAPAPRPRWLRPALVTGAAGLAAAAALALVLGWRSISGHDDDLSAEADAETHTGELVARGPEIVRIGDRAAVSVEPGADLAWSVRARRVRVSQRRGSVLYRVRKGGPFHVETPAGHVEVTGTSFRVELPGAGATAGSTVVSVLEGSVRVRSGAGELSLGAGQRARLLRDRPPALLPPPAAEAPPMTAPTEAARPAATGVARRRLALASTAREPAALLLPPARGLEVYGRGLDEVSLALPRGKGAATVEVSRDPRFTDDVWRGPARGFVTVPAPARGDLYWRVLGGQGRGRKLVGHARFRPDSSGVGVTERPHNVVSDERESTTIYFQSAVPALTLAFSATPGARAYRVRLAAADDPQRAIVDRVVQRPRCPVAADVLAEGRYVWTAVPLDGRGRPLSAEKATAVPRRLDLAYDNALSRLTITAPAAGAAVNGSTVEVEGVAPLGARLSINGRPVSVDDKGRFSTRLPGPPRTLIFRLLDRDGAERYWVRPLRAGS